MTQTGQILRKGQVKITGQCRVGEAGHAPVAAAAVPAARPAAAPAPAVVHGEPKASIIETTPTGVVIEFACPCGCRSFIECEWA